MTPLEITAHLRGPIALPHGPMAIDALLAAAVALRDRIPLALNVADIVDIEIPVEREPGKRFYLASFSVGQMEAAERHWVNRRFPIPEAQGMGNTKLRTINITSGPCKSYRLPLEAQHLDDDSLRWWCIGDRDEITGLLGLIRYLGKRRAVGKGRVVQWDVEHCEPWGEGFPVVRNGKPLRPLPPDWHGLVDPPLAYRTLHYPYWLHTREALCAIPE